MNIVVTGHTSGIGKSIYDHLSKLYNVVGLSRSTGFDIDINDIGEYLDSDVIINNAYSDANGQSLLLLRLYDAGYVGQVINIGSISMDRTDAAKYSQILYSANKKHLYITHEHCQRRHFDTSILILGMVDTEYNREKLGKKLTLEEVSAKVGSMIYLPSGEYYL